MFGVSAIGKKKKNPKKPQSFLNVEPLSFSGVILGPTVLLIRLLILENESDKKNVFVIFGHQLLQPAYRQIANRGMMKEHQCRKKSDAKKHHRRSVTSRDASSDVTTHVTKHLSR